MVADGVVVLALGDVVVLVGVLGIVVVVVRGGLYEFYFACVCVGRCLRACCWMACVWSLYFK